MEEINIAYRDLWKKYRKMNLPRKIKNYFDVWPMQYDTTIRKQNLLFIGFNPSYDDSKNELKLSEESSLENTDQIIRAIEDERTAQRGSGEKKRYRYYNPFPDICETLGLDSEDWNHIDLLPFRHKAQNELIAVLHLDRKVRLSQWYIGGSAELDILKDCLSILLGFIRYIDPKVIVVVNGFISSKIIDYTGSYYVSGKKASGGKTSCVKSDLSLFLSSDHKENHRILRIMDKEYPLLVSAMLFGQRALDLSSKERLIWHIKKLLGDKQ
jgi:hypothetical protein